MCFIVIYWTRFSENFSSLRPFVDCYHDLNLWIERNAKTKSRTWDEKFVTFRHNIARDTICSSFPDWVTRLHQTSKSGFICPPKRTFDWCRLIYISVHLSGLEFQFSDISLHRLFKSRRVSADQSRERTLHTVDENLCSTRWFRGRPDKSRCRFPAKNTF